MDPHLEAGILTASQSLQLPGYGERRVIAPVAVKRLATGADCPLWEVEALALDVGVVPVHYLRNLAEFSMKAQSRLLRAAVALIGVGPAIERAHELLALQGIGRLVSVVPAITAVEEPVARHQAQLLGKRVHNRNLSCEVDARTVRFGENPADALLGVDVAASCIQDSSSEMLLQFACRMKRVPLVLAGVEGNRAQATTVMPGDPGVALVYKPAHPHLSADRSSSFAQPRAGLAAGAWIAQQTVALLLEASGILRHRLLYADLDTGEMAEHLLGRGGSDPDALGQS